jgi:hypothetical protein
MEILIFHVFLHYCAVFWPDALAVFDLKPVMAEDWK